MAVTGASSSVTSRCAVMAASAPPRLCPAMKRFPPAAIDEAQAPQRKNVPHLVRLVRLIGELGHPCHCLAVAERKRLPALERRECIRAVALSWQFGEKAQGGLPVLGFRAMTTISEV